MIFYKHLQGGRLPRKKKKRFKQRVLESYAVTQPIFKREKLHSCKYVNRIGESCTLNNNCKYPNCE